IQRRRSTTTRRAQAESPPPKLASAISRNAAASAPRLTSWRPISGAAPRSSGRAATSLMDEARVVRQVALVVWVQAKRIGRHVLLALVPVVLEQLSEGRRDVVVLDDHPELATDVEGAAVDVHRADERALSVDDDQLGVKLEVLLPSHLGITAL